MLSRKLFSFYSILTPLFATTFAADPNYWVDKSCSDKEGFNDALNEVIWGSGELAKALQGKDQRLKDPLKWLYNIWIDEQDDQEPLNMVANTFSRVSTLKSTSDQKTALVRFMCDAGTSFVPKDIDGKELKEPIDYDGKRAQVYHDEGNDVWEKGGNLPCKIANPSLIVLAETQPFIQRRNDDLLIQASNTQPADRVTINVYEVVFTKEGDKSNPLWFLPTFREAATDNAPLDMMIATAFSNHLAKTLMHELVHVPFLSKQDQIRWPLDGVKYVSSVGDHGRDEHGPLKDSGDYFYEQPLNDFPGSRLYLWQYTVMNPDSYAYMLMLFRFIQKQWKPIEKRYDPETSDIKEDGPVTGIGFVKTTDWDLVREDWPGSGETPTWGSRNPEL